MRVYRALGEDYELYKEEEKQEPTPKLVGEASFDLSFDISFAI